MSNQNHDEKKEKLEEAFINNLFEKKDKDQNEQLYKNEFYILEEEIKSKKNQNNLQFMHDILLNKLMLEDYVPFPPKNEEPIIVNNQKEEKKKEDDQDKLVEEENEFLRSLHKINYLTFSPFGLSFFEDNTKDKNNANEDLMKEKEEKILHMIDFNYDNFEVTNDLLLNICQGFVDINKLKEENLTKNKEKQRERERQREALLNNLKKKEEDANKIEEKKNEKEILEKYEIDFLEEIKIKRDIKFYQNFIKPCEEEFKESNNREERKEIIAKWTPKIREKDIEYEIYLKDLEEKQRKELEEKERLREIEKKKEIEREEEERNNERLMKAFQEIINRNKKKAGNSKSQNKSKRVNSQNKIIKQRNKSTNMSDKKGSKTTKINNKSPFGGARANPFSTMTKYLNKNVSKSQVKIKTLPNKYFK